MALRDEFGRTSCDIVVRDAAHFRIAHGQFATAASAIRNTGHW